MFGSTHQSVCFVHMISENLRDIDPFFLNVKKSVNGKVLLQNRSPTVHSHIILTSKALMKNCEKQGVFHIDCKYKLLKNCFALIVIRVNDIYFCIKYICVKSRFNVFSGFEEILNVSLVKNNAV